MPLDLQIPDDVALDAHLVTFQDLRDEISALTAAAIASSEESNVHRDRYAARIYETLKGRTITERTVDIFAFASDVITSTATGSSTWDTGGDGALVINANDPTGSAVLEIDLSKSGTALLATERALTARLRGNASPQELDLQVTVSLTDSDGNASFSSRLRQIGTSIEETEIRQVQEEIPSGPQGDILRFDVAWQMTTSGASVDIIIGDKGLFNDHDSQLNEDEVLLARQKIFEETASFTTVSGQVAASHTGALVIVTPASGTVIVELADDASYGDQIEFLLDVSGITAINFDPAGTDAISSDFTHDNLDSSDQYRIVTAHYWDDNGTDTWNLSISAGDT